MRLWTLHPSVLDQKGLGACWREGLGARSALIKQKGYFRHPQLQRFKAFDDPVAAVDTYLHAIADEADTRGYSYNRRKLGPKGNQRLAVTEGQLLFEYQHLLSKVALRAPQWLSQIDAQKHHPMFDVVPGGVESWEKV
jgi:hypothetical protein